MSQNWYGVISVQDGVLSKKQHKFLKDLQYSYEDYGDRHVYEIGFTSKGVDDQFHDVMNTIDEAGDTNGAVLYTDEGGVAVQEYGNWPGAGIKIRIEYEGE